MGGKFLPPPGWKIQSGQPPAPHGMHANAKTYRSASCQGDFHLPGPLTTTNIEPENGKGGEMNTTPPPKDGTPIIAVGRIIYEDEISTIVDPFCAVIFWKDGNSCSYPGWYYFWGYGMAIASSFEDTVKVDYWDLLPGGGK